jgi:hypothetical protein
MKIIFMQLLMLLNILPACNAQQNNTETMVECTYKSGTRGSHLELVITKDSLILNQTGFKNYVLKKQLNEDEWNSLSEIIKEIDLKKMNGFNAPTDGRKTDRAWHSSITVKTDKAEYSSQAFDNTDAPKELSKLMEQIKSLAEIKL